MLINYNLHAPQTRPSFSMLFADLSISFISVSSSQGLMSSKTEVLAIKAGFFDFFSWYAFNLSAVTRS